MVAVNSIDESATTGGLLVSNVAGSGVGGSISGLVIAEAVDSAVIVVVLPAASLNCMVYSYSVLGISPVSV